MSSFSEGAKRRPAVRLRFAGDLNMVIFSCYFMVLETPADKKVPFFEVGSCSWGTYWQFRLGRFLIRFLKVIFMKDIIDC